MKKEYLLVDLMFKPMAGLLADDFEALDDLVNDPEALEQMRAEAVESINARYSMEADPMFEFSRLELHQDDDGFYRFAIYVMMDDRLYNDVFVDEPTNESIRIVKENLYTDR